MRMTSNLQGERFGRLLVTGFEPGKGWACLCDCGERRVLKRAKLTAGLSVSCGCKKHEAIAAGLNRRHGHATKGVTSEYHSWTNMKNRCAKPTHIDYHNYGGIGISVCIRWHTFANFIADMGCKPNPKWTIDRIRTDRGYWCGKAECGECGPAKREPNCRWATQQTQQNNRRNNRRLEHDGQNLTVAEWGRKTGLGHFVIRTRLRNGWSVADALSTQLQKQSSD